MESKQTEDLMPSNNNTFYNIQAAILRSDKEQLTVLLKNSEAKQLINQVKKGSSLLDDALLVKDVPVIQCLLMHGADSAWVNSWGRTPFHGIVVPPARLFDCEQGDYKKVARNYQEIMAVLLRQNPQLLTMPTVPVAPSLPKTPLSLIAEGWKDYLDSPGEIQEDNSRLINCFKAGIRVLFAARSRVDNANKAVFDADVQAVLTWAQSENCEAIVQCLQAEIKKTNSPGLLKILGYVLLSPVMLIIAVIALGLWLNEKRPKSSKPEEQPLSEDRPHEQQQDKATAETGKTAEEHKTFGYQFQRVCGSIIPRLGATNGIKVQESDQGSTLSPETTKISK